MDQNPPETESPAEAMRKELDLDNPDPWLEKYINKPSPGFEDKKNPDGTSFSFEQALEASREQFRRLAINRKENLEYINKSRREDGLEPISQEEFDKSLKGDFITEALEERESTSERK